MADAADQFDQGFYDRFYRDPARRVAETDDTDRLVAFVASYLKHLDIPVHSSLDLGCGLGLWRGPLGQHFPDASYQGVEVSQHLCAELGWAQGSIATWEGEGADLVVCHGVLQYLTGKEARAAIRNLARLTRGALYLEALTKEDWAENCDQERTDGDVHLRKASWYRRQLAGHFIALGGGLFLPADHDVVLYELERPG